MSENISLDPTSIEYLKGYVEGVEYPTSDQRRGIPGPDFEKPLQPGQKLIKLPDPATVQLRSKSIYDCILNRVSNRIFTKDGLSLEELSFLLWATQGVKSKVDDQRHKHHAVRRTVPSAGCRHPFEAYVVINRIKGLDEGIYRYIGSKHALVLEANPVNLVDQVNAGTLGQCFCGAAPVFFLWSVIPYRTIWRYGLPMSVKAITLDAGHIGQNLHVACEALGLGTCMIGAYDQNFMDNLFGFDGENEFAFYMAPVGRI
jgi:SagB-type dehydrogenase family enzyme